MDISKIAIWQDHRARVEGWPDTHPGSSKNPQHNVAHIIKAMGPLADMAEHRAHNEPYNPVDAKRAADLIVHAIWLARDAGFDPATIVHARMLSFNDGFDLVREPFGGYHDPRMTIPCYTPACGVRVHYTSGPRVLA